MSIDDVVIIRRVLLSAAAFVFALVCFGLSRSATAAPEPCRWRVTRDKVTTSGGSLAFLAVENAEPFAAAYLGQTTGGEQWAILTRVCER